MEIQNAPPIKSNNPAPTVEQINADRITQVNFFDYYVLIIVTKNYMMIFYIPNFVTVQIFFYFCHCCAL